MNFLTWLNKINGILNKENSEVTKILSTDKKYIALKNWLDENKAEYKNTLQFPVAYGPFNIVGCKSAKQITENEALFFIPRSLMILSSDYEDILPICVQDEEENKSTLILTLFLLEEEQKENSFFKPYIDLFPEQDYIIFWDEKYLKEMDNEKIILSAHFLYYEIYEIYSKLIKIEKYRSITPQKFATFFCHVLSRQFYIDDATSALIPCADLLNHDTVKIKYEIYDSENYVFKYTAHLCNGNSKDLQYTKSSNPPINSPSYNKYEPINLTGSYSSYNYNTLTEENADEEEEEDGPVIEIKQNDYFVLSTSTNQEYKKGVQVFSNYSNMANKTLLKYYGFCLLDNKYDYTVIIFSFFRGKDLMFEKYLEIAFRKKYSTTSDPFNNIIKLKVKFNTVCYDLIRYYRFMYLYNHKRTSDFLIYSFERDIEINAIEESINKIKKELDYLEENHPLKNDQVLLEDLLNDPKKENHRMVTIVIFRITQKRNLLYQIDLLSSLLFIIKNNNVKSYLEILDFVGTLNNISEYDIDERSKKRLSKFITKIVKI